jgi:hypothetical protein
MRRRVLFALLVIALIVPTLPVAQDLGADVQDSKMWDRATLCTEGCWSLLEQAIKACSATDDPDPKACTQKALESFAARLTICATNRYLSVYLLPNGRYQLEVRRKAPEPAPDAGGASRRKHVLTAPVLRGVRLSSRTFRDYESVSRHIMKAYENASPAQDTNGDCVSGCQPGNPPRIFILLPSSGGAFMPVGIGGTNFDRGTVPFFSEVPSLALFEISERNIPLLGSISVGFTIVPPAAPAGPGDVVIEYNGQRSNLFPFAVNRP